MLAFVTAWILTAHADLNPDLGRDLAALVPTAQTCVSSVFAAGLRNRVRVSVTCAGVRLYAGEVTGRETIAAALSLVTERFAELGYASSCGAASMRRPFHGDTAVGSVLCVHQRK